jgi:xanthine dehydrogenase accessory factor
MSAIFVVIDAVRGSAPRDAGTAMKVTADATEGTIGGGALEFRAIALAREMLAKGAPEFVRKVPLGPGLGQCCGGVVTLRFTRQEHAVDAHKFIVHRLKGFRSHPRFLWLWGAGHVGRAVVMAAGPQAFKITWVDSAADRFPKHIPAHVKTLPAADMPLLAARAPTTAHHLIFTYSHDIDFALSAALLQRGAASIGLIGSQTKRTRFFKRLREMGLDPAPITCPIGDPRLGKAPDAIARGVVADFKATEAAA